MKDYDSEFDKEVKESNYSNQGISENSIQLIGLEKYPSLSKYN